MKKVVILVVFVLLLALIPSALAGGWASVEVDDLPSGIRAGETWTVGMMVLRHGVTPVHMAGPGQPMEPTFQATNAATGEKVVAVAVPAEEVGRFTLEVTLPTEGEWEWTIYPAPLAGDEKIQSLSVLPPAATSSAQAFTTALVGGAPLPAVVGIGVLVVALGVLPWLYARRGTCPRPSEG